MKAKTEAGQKLEHELRTIRKIHNLFLELPDVAAQKRAMEFVTAQLAGPEVITIPSSSASIGRPNPLE